MYISFNIEMPRSESTFTGSVIGLVALSFIHSFKRTASTAFQKSGPEEKDKYFNLYYVFKYTYERIDQFVVDDGIPRTDVRLTSVQFQKKSFISTINNIQKR